MILDNTGDDKFVLDPLTKSFKISNKYIGGIKEFNLLKKLVSMCADKAGLVDSELLFSLVD